MPVARLTQRTSTRKVELIAHDVTAKVLVLLANKHNIILTRIMAYSDIRFYSLSRTTASVGNVDSC